MKCPIHPDQDHTALYAEPYWDDGNFIIRCSLKSLVINRLNQLQGNDFASSFNVGFKTITYEQLKPSLDFKAFCSHCGKPGCTKEDSRTAYENPSSNLPHWYCPECACMHHDYWDATWNEYYSGLM